MNNNKINEIALVDQFLARLVVCKSKLLIYILLYTVTGLGMHHFGDWIKIARFVSVYQVFSCYILLLVPISLFLRSMKWHDQYLYGFFAIAVIELTGYSLGTSLSFEGNFVDQIFGPRNFTLAMSFFHATFIPLGNWTVEKIH